MTIMFVTTDCYGTVRVTWQGANLQTNEFVMNPEIARALGAFAQDPSGWMQRYSRPNPFSTAGLYVGIAYSGGAQGSTLPYVPAVILEVSLSAESTQESARVEAVAWVVAITNMTAFIRSLRRLLDAKASLDIDPDLFAEFKGEK